MLVLKLISGGSGTWMNHFISIEQPFNVNAAPPKQKNLYTGYPNSELWFPNWRIELPGNRLTFQFDPGTKYQYSGEGFEYLRHTLESKFHKPLDQPSQRDKLLPLGLNDSHYT
ncbi:hypothetical protein TH53_23715 [Pedobacter lusitanus]|uniref:Contig127, whole genome shotgun sequence n=1 Tax=Pedobacter lusitanus TaxID=1503925 RepID=A0A0D0GFI5_9SPHI|nr:hypothetical protein TH53_23715 [Pedobacter lusitanus]